MKLDGSHSVSSTRTALMLIIAGAYLAFPVFSGAWFYGRIECVYLWSEAAKHGLSLFAYIGIGFFAWRKMRPDILTSDGELIGYVSAIFLGVATASNVLHKCW